MAKASEILKQKGATVHTINHGATVLAATRLMNSRKIGALVVVDDQDGIAGIFTERDVLQRVVAQQRDPATSLVEEVMTAQVICCNPSMELEDIRTLMKNNRIRHLPVVGEDGQLVGMISIGDVNAYLSGTQEVTIQYLNEYLHGRV
ncbi:MAG: CBS domain-containing protein [Phycisphaeraceae bacterium]|nr:CBS domain-containing protein [Phycisphaeraceae bacterium]